MHVSPSQKILPMQGTPVLFQAGTADMAGIRLLQRLLRKDKIGGAV
jgi:hypothetical protein